MLYKCLFIVVFVLCSLYTEARICESIDARNTIEDLETKLRGCTIVAGVLQIVLFETKTQADFRNVTFPELTEISGYLVFYRVRGLTSLGKLFPNLSLIRGVTLFLDYAFVVFDMPDLQEIGFHNLTHIKKGSIRIDRCPRLCYVDTINWTKITSDELHYFDKTDTCEACPPHCNGYCWNQKYCQVISETQCDAECLGCRGPGSHQCYVCKSVSDNNTCVPKCPDNKYHHSMLSKCVTREECSTIMNSTWWTFNGECTQTCPPNYEQVSKEEGWCKYCGNDCTKVCQGILVDSISSAQRLRGCTYINGSLSIRVDAKKVMQDLEKNLDMIEEIKDSLKIYRSSSLTSLTFFKRLRVIHGEVLDDKQHSVIVFENQNLHQLWDWDNFTVQIKNGTLLFHNNPKLCLHEIKRFAELTGIKNMSAVDVSPYSNGDETECNKMNLTINVVETNPTNVTLLWNSFAVDSNTTLIGYFVFYMEYRGENTTTTYRDSCDEGGWDAIFVQNSTITITKLKAFTKYAFYIKTYTSNNAVGGQTQVHYFHTLSDDPSNLLNVQAIATSNSSIKLRWNPPEQPNGLLSYYVITGFLEKDDAEFIAERNYCKHKHLSYDPHTTSDISTSDLWSNSSNNALCVCSFDHGVQMINQEFDVLCDRVNTVSETDIVGQESCRNYRYETISSPNAIRISKRDSVKKVGPRLRNMVELKIPTPNITSYEIKNLQHFSIYIFFISVCNENKTLRPQCSSVVMVSERTAKSDHADDIPQDLIVSTNGADVAIKWNEPFQPNSIIVSYQVELKRTDLEYTKIPLECITREQHQKNGFEYKVRSLHQGKYLAKVRATSLAGPGNYKEIEFQIAMSSNNATPLIASIVTVFVALIAIAAFFIWRYKKKQEMENMHLIATINPDYAGTVYVEDDWELERDDVDINNELGQGTFGLVYNGFIKSQSRPCAIKTVTENANTHERMEFLNEASVMKAFNEAHHVVKLLGVVSKGQPPLVVMELMARGDLKSFLRRSRDSSNCITCVEMYRMAAEIADGMAYLSAKKFVHRDLAARNCMVSADHTVKIGDFGMTRDIYENDYYRKESKGLLPIRWMAPESLADGVFTSDSDVWSYGVVLWEMATLAEQPYQGLANEQVLQFVIARGTLERPAECPDLLYEIMEACSKWRPINRPLFTDIVTKLESHVGQDFRLVSFYHSREGEEYRMNARQRVYNQPAMDVPQDRDPFVHWNISDEDVSLYSVDSNRPNPFLSFSHQRPSRSSHDSYQ